MFRCFMKIKGGHRYLHTAYRRQRQIFIRDSVSCLVNPHELFFFFFISPRPPRTTTLISVAASDVYKRLPFSQRKLSPQLFSYVLFLSLIWNVSKAVLTFFCPSHSSVIEFHIGLFGFHLGSVFYTHIRAHETREDLVCLLLLEKKKKKKK